MIMFQSVIDQWSWSSGSLTDNHNPVDCWPKSMLQYTNAGVGGGRKPWPNSHMLQFMYLYQKLGLKYAVVMFIRWHQHTCYWFSITQLAQYSNCPGLTTKQNKCVFWALRKGDTSEFSAPAIWSLTFSLPHSISLALFCHCPPLLPCSTLICIV